jgi:hypothetical protein
MARIDLSPAQLADARNLYEQTLVPVEDIARSLGVSERWFYREITQLGWRRRRCQARSFHFAKALSEAAAQLPARLEQAVPPAPPCDPARLAAARLALAIKLHATADRVLDSVAQVVAALDPANQAEAQRSACILAQIAHALREVAHLTEPEPAAAAHEPEQDDDPVPRDLDEFRRELARRIRGFIELRRSGLDQQGRDGGGSPAGAGRRLG